MSDMDTTTSADAIALIYGEPVDYTPADLDAARADATTGARSLYDLPIFGRFWAADGADLGR